MNDGYKETTVIFSKEEVEQISNFNSLEVLYILSSEEQYEERYLDQKEEILTLFQSKFEGI